MPVVDPVKKQIEAFGAKAFGLQHLAQLDDKLAYIAGDRLGCGDGLAKTLAHLNKIGWTNGIDRLADTSHDLIEATAKFRTEAKRERRARLVHQFADTLEAQHAKTLDHIPGQTKRCDWQIANCGRAFARRNDKNRPGGIAGEGISGGPAVRDGGACGET